MTTLLAVSDIHCDKTKLEQMVNFSKGCDLILTCGDDFDKMLGEGQYESNALIASLVRQHGQGNVSPETEKEFMELLQRAESLSKEEQEREIAVFLQKHPEVVEHTQRLSSLVKTKFLEHYSASASAINEHYKRTGIPVFGTAGNHDPLPALKQMTAVKYLFGQTASSHGLSIAGLPATGEWVPGPLKFCPEFFEHLKHYTPVMDENEPAEVSGLAKRLLEHSGPVDVFVTHKAYRLDLQEWDEHYAEDERFGVDGGAVAVAKKHQPKLNVFGHYHMERPKVAERNGTFHVYVGPNAVVKIVWDKGKPAAFESVYYN